MAPVLGAASIAKLVSNSPVTASSLSDRVPSYLFELMPWFEIGLALWLISRRAKFGSWLIATVLFALFSIHAGLLTAQQQSSCGCLGSVTVPPIITLAIDLALLTLLVDREQPGESVRTIRQE